LTGCNFKKGEVMAFPDMPIKKRRKLQKILVGISVFFGGITVLMLIFMDGNEVPPSEVGIIDDSATNQTDENKIVVGLAGELIFDASAFPDDWNVSGANSSDVESSYIRGMKRVGISLPDIIEVRVNLYPDIESARSEFSKTAEERSDELNTINLGDEAFGYETINGNKIYFRYLNVVANVHSLASAGLSGSEKKALEWSEKLVERIQRTAQ
jgi:hypothetical protein